VPLTVGETAPVFALRDQFGRTIRLDDEGGSTGVLLVFFPQAFTPQCTEELRALDDEAPELAARGVSVLAVSVDSIATLRAFSEHSSIAVPLLSDFWPHGAVAAAYGAFLRDRGWADRVSFLLDAERVIRAVVRGSDSAPRTGAAHRAALDVLDRGQG
jgi:mycoredoxin-dependent peroxiredoxin